jgi:hypothetical protein
MFAGIFPLENVISERTFVGFFTVKLQRVKKKENECNICEKGFANIGDFMHHKKIEHADIVQMCKNTNSCTYQNCWFHHEQNNEKEEVTEKILSMMEKFTQRIVNLENLINK